MTIPSGNDYQFSGYDASTRQMISTFHATRERHLVLPILSGVCFYFLPKENQTLKPDSPLEELLGAVKECGSLTLVEFLLAVEEAMRVEFSDAEMRSIRNAGEFLALIDSKIALPTTPPQE